MRYTITSRTLKRDITFSRPGSYYIHVDLNGKAGGLGDQICRGGWLMGSTLGIDGDDDDPNVREKFERTCRNWWKQYLSRA